MKTAEKGGEILRQTVSCTEDSRVLRNAPVFSLLQGNMLLLCFHNHYAFKAHHWILGQPEISPFHLHLVLEVQKSQNQLTHKPTYSAFYMQCQQQQFLHDSSRLPWALQAQHTPCVHTGHAATAGVRTDRQRHLIRWFSINSVNTPHINQQVQPRLPLYKPAVLNSKHSLLYLLTKQHWAMSFTTAGSTWAVTEETTDWWSAIFCTQLSLW